MDLVYQCYCGSPSGSAITVEVNSLVNVFYVYLAFYNLVTKVKGIPLLEFENYVVLVTYGDDLIMSVKEDLIEDFNCLTIGSYLKTLDIVFTDATKKGLVKYDTLENSTFLKRGFKKHPTRRGEWLAPLDLVSVNDCALWINKGEPEEQATIVNVQASLNLAYGHGKEFFEEHRKKLKRACEMKDLRFPCLTWEELDFRFFGAEEVEGIYQIIPQPEVFSSEKRKIQEFALRNDWYDDDHSDDLGFRDMVIQF